MMHGLSLFRMSPEEIIFNQAILIALIFAALFCRNFYLPGINTFR